MRLAVSPLAVLTLAIAVALVACTPVVNQRGYLPDPALEGSIKTGTDTKTSVQKHLGDPSTTATFGGRRWPGDSWCSCRHGRYTSPSLSPGSR